MQGLQHVALLGVAFGSRPGLSGQIETAYILRPGKQTFFHKNAGETVGQGQGGLTQNTGLHRCGINGFVNGFVRKGVAHAGALKARPRPGNRKNLRPGPANLIKWR
jgi:hypothetical protein